MRPLIPLVLLLALLVPQAAAQTPPSQAEMRVTIKDLPPAFPEFKSNDSHAVPITVEVTMNGVVCAQAAQIGVTLAVATGSPIAFFTVAPETEKGSIAVNPGPYVSPPGNSFTGTFKTNIRGNATIIESNVTAPVTVTATVTGPAGCSASPTAPPATAMTNATLVAPPLPPPPTPIQESPGPGALTGVVLAMVFAAVLRRRF